MIRKLAMCAALFFWVLPLIMAHGEQEDFFRNSGKIYVVVAVLAVIFFSLILYLFYLDRKISKLEKEISHGDKNE